MLWRRATHERSCVPPAREGAERPRTRAPAVGAHLGALHEDETFDPRDDRRLHDERVLAVVIAIIISIVVVLRLCLCVPVGTTPPSSHPSHQEEEELHKKNAHAVPLASARQHPENQMENQAGHSSERTAEGQAYDDDEFIKPRLRASS